MFSIPSALPRDNYAISLLSDGSPQKTTMQLHHDGKDVPIFPSAVEWRISHDHLATACITIIAPPALLQNASLERVTVTRDGVASESFDVPLWVLTALRRTNVVPSPTVLDTLERAQSDDAVIDAMCAAEDAFVAHRGIDDQRGNTIEDRMRALLAALLAHLRGTPDA